MKCLKIFLFQLATGSFFGWGAAELLGINEQGDLNNPFLITPLASASKLVTGHWHNLALIEGGVFGTGSNSHSQLCDDGIQLFF